MSTFNSTGEGRFRGVILDLPETAHRESVVHQPVTRTTEK